MTNAHDSWDKLLNPELLKQNLVQCSLFISGYEILRNAIVDRLHGFYANEFFFNEEGEAKAKVTAEYKEKVISLYPRDELHACCLWFQNHGAFDEQDLQKVSSIRKHRNYIAHEITKVISSDKHSVDHRIVANLIEIVQKIDIWWIKEVEVPTNPDFDSEYYEAIDWENVIGGNHMLLTLLMSLFHGDDQYLSEMHKSYKEALKKWNEQ